MIQKTNPRRPNTSSAPTTNDGPEVWGHWSGHKHYSLEVVQHPLRARMCGFGDKDRRPLAPAAVAKMIVKYEDDSLVDVDEVDCSFFLVTVDLWSADGKHEMNLVLPPSSADRYVPPNAAPKSKRRGTSSTTTPRSGHPNIIPNNPRHPDQNPAAHSAIPPPASGYTPGYPFPPPLPTQDSHDYQQPPPYGPPPSGQPPSWGYANHGASADRGAGYPPPALPSIHTFGPNNTPTTNPIPPPPSNENWSQAGSGRNQPDMATYRGWQTDSAFHAQEASNSHIYNGNTVDPSLRGAHPSASNSDSQDSSWSHNAPEAANRYPHDSYAHPQPGTSNQYDGSIYNSTIHANQPIPHYPGAYAPPHQGTPPPQTSQPMSAIPPLPRHTYTRTLVGPLSSNACRLLDEHRKVGIFYLFQDLSVRTEGTFRLRLRLMNVGVPPAPEAGAMRVHNDISPVLAQTFTEPFVVYSAKRFPGVPDTTALSIALGNQGQKLPLRNRHGSGKQGRRRQRSDTDVSDDDSDGG